MSGLPLSRLSWLLVVILLLAFALRWDNYPKTYFADELIPLAVVKHMHSSGTLDTNWENADWRGDYAGGFYKLKQYNFSSYHTALYGFQSLCVALGFNAEPLVFYRYFSVLCQLLAVLLVFALTDRLFGLSSALLAALFLAVAPQAVVDAHYARPESWVIFLVALACWLATQVCLEKKIRYALLEGLVWGVAFACKFSFFPMVFLAWIANAFVLRCWKISLLWAVAFLSGVWLSAPYIIKDMAGFFHGIELLRNQYAAPPVVQVGVASYFPSLLPLSAYLAVFFTVPVFLVMGYSLIVRRKKSAMFLWLSGGVSVFYIGLFAKQGVFFERNLSHLLPLWSVLFGVGSYALWLSMRQVCARWSMLACLVLCVVWLLGLSFSIDKEMFLGLADNHEKLTKDEAVLAQHFSASKVVVWNVMAPLGKLKTEGKSVIYRVSLLDVPERPLIEKAFEQAGFVRVADREMPLAFLPYNQLQINQFSSRYVYYQLMSFDANKGSHD